MTPIDPFLLEQMAGGFDDPNAGRPRSCPECNYDLRGTPLSRPCPECGWAPQGSRIGETTAEPEGTPCVKCGASIIGMVFGAICPDCAVGSRRHGQHTGKCSACGYNLAGLGPSPTCPECGDGGNASSAGPNTGPVRLLRGRVPLPTLSLDTKASIGWQLGLLMLVCIGMLWAVIAVCRPLGLIDNSTWTFLVQANAIGLAFACVFVTPASADGAARAWLRPIRWLARILILGLVAGSLTWSSFWIEATLAFTGLLGLTMLLWILAMYARVSESQHLSRQFELGWIFAIPCGVLSWLLPFPSNVAALPPTVMGYVVMFFVVFMLIPTFVLCWYICRPSMSFLHESVWARQNLRQQSAIDRSRRGERNCPSCGYSLKGLNRRSPCPECGCDA